MDYRDPISGGTCNERGPKDMISGHEATMHIGGTSGLITEDRLYTDEKDPISGKLEPALPEPHALHTCRTRF